MTELTDAAARTLITTATSETLFVEAGAGTGKTTALVGRIVALIREGVPVTSIAAITFTEKAASELAERVRQQLELAAEKAAPGSQRELLTRAIQDLDQAAIQTLHSFAMRILGLYPLEAGLPPAISLRDDVEAKLAFRERWQRFQDELLESPELQRVLLRGLTIGLRLTDLRELAEIFNENWERLEHAHLPECDEPRLDPSSILDPLGEVAAARRPGADDSMTRRLDSVAPYLSALDSWRGRRVGAASEEVDELEVELLRRLTKMPSLARSTSGKTSNLGQAKNWPPIDHYRALITEAEAARDHLLDGTRSYVICSLLPHIRNFVLEGARQRRTAGELEFHDLLVLARNLLRDDAAARAALHRRFTRVLIDEFQDTDPIQVELAALLASDSPEVSEWSGVLPDPGRLFFVGDPKQSIYRFRRADIDLFKRARAAFGSRQVPLTKNFRCRPEIIEWVNTVCAEIFGGFGGGADPRQADWIALEPGRTHLKTPAVHFLGGPRNVDSAAVWRAEEADAIVATIQKARAENWLARGERGAVTLYKDIAILVPTRTNAPAIERALGVAGIPVRVESRSLLFAAQEIRDLTNILAAVDDPTDDVAVVAALRTPAFGVSDADLLEHVKASGRWDYTRPAPDTSPEPVRSAMADLGEFHQDRWHGSIGALVERVLARRKMLELSATGPRPREAWRRLRFVAEQARVLGNSGAVSSLRQFVHWLRTQAEEGTRIAEAVASEPDDDAVRLLTIHAAKGLEFPIVILAGLGVPPRQTPARVLFTTQDGVETLAVHCGRTDFGFDSPNYAGLKQFEREHSALERHRLFYVAATRARERLVVSLFHKPTKEAHESKHADQRCNLAECLEALRDSTWDVPQLGMPMGNGDAATSSDEDTPEDRAAWVAARAERIARLSNAHAVAATTLAHELDIEETERLPETAERQPWKKGRAGTSVGRAVHAVLQTANLATGEGVEETAEAQAIAEGIADEATRIARLAHNARFSGPVQAALASAHYWREMYAGARIEGVLIEGFIDLLYESPDGLVIVDYKTDSARDEAAIDRAMERYRLQGAAYALMLEAAVGQPVANCVFVFTEPRLDRQVPDLETAKADVREMLRQRFRLS